MAKSIYSRQSLFGLMIPEGYESVTQKNDNKQQAWWKDTESSHLELQTQSKKLPQMVRVFKFSKHL